MDSAEPDLRPDRPLPINWGAYVEWLKGAWAQLLDSDPPEPKVQDFLEANPSLVPGSVGDVGPGGHHGPMLGGVFAEPPLEGLDRDRRPDFMWVTRSTSLITPICVEIEKPAKNWFRKSGAPTAEFTQALDQLTDWKLWFSEPVNQQIFRATYMDGQFSHRELRPQYLLIFGRQCEFTREHGRHLNPDRLRKKRDLMARRDEQFMTFDSLTPDPRASDFLTLSMTVDGPRVKVVPPTFTTGPTTADDATTLGSLDGALMNSELLTEQRRSHIRDRWEHWRTAPRKKAYSIATGE